MRREAFAGYGSALRIASSVRLAEYDRQTVIAFIADLFSKDYSDVERDVGIVAESRLRPWSPLDELKA